MAVRKEGKKHRRMRHKDEINDPVNAGFNFSPLRYREKDSRMPNWIELPVNPPNARKIQIHNLAAGTTYEFQVRSVSIMHPPPPPPTPFRPPNVIVVSFSDLLAFKIHFQIIGINEYGDGMMSQIVEARTKGKIQYYEMQLPPSFREILLGFHLFSSPGNIPSSSPSSRSVISQFLQQPSRIQAAVREGK